MSLHGAHHLRSTPPSQRFLGRTEAVVRMVPAYGLVRLSDILSAASGRESISEPLPLPADGWFRVVAPSSLVRVARVCSRVGCEQGCFCLTLRIFLVTYLFRPFQSVSTRFHTTRALCSRTNKSKIDCLMLLRCLPACLPWLSRFNFSIMCLRGGDILVYTPYTTSSFFLAPNTTGKRTTFSTSLKSFGSVSFLPFW